MKNLVSTRTDFDLVTGLSKTRKPLQRFLSQMKNIYYDNDAFEAQLQKEGFRKIVVERSGKPVIADNPRKRS